MKGLSRGRRLLVSAALVAAVLASLPAYGAMYQTNYYNLSYTNATELSWAKSLSAYLDRAAKAATTVIGYSAWNGRPTIYIYNKNDGYAGYMYSGQQSIYLNRYYFKSYEYWGSVIAHETAHILFFNYTGAAKWNSGLLYYTTFLTEALSWYAGDYVYNSARYTSSSAYYEIKTNLKSYSAKTGYILSWYGAGYYYRNYPGGNLGAQTIWQLRAIGYYLTGGSLTASNSALMKTLSTMRGYSSYSGSYLRSYTYSTARSYFEASFKAGYGYYANAGWIYASYTCTNYLFGKFYNSFYR